MSKNVKLADIAERIGLSIVTVSKALAGKSGVSEENRRRIKSLADEMGYVAVEPAAKQPSKTGNIGVIIPDRYLEVGNSFYWSMYQYIVSQMKDKGFYTILEILQNEAEASLTIPDIIADEKVDGIILLGQLKSDYCETLWQRYNSMMLFLDFYEANSEYDVVVSDGFHGMYHLTSYFIQSGNTKIGFVGTPLATSSITDRYLGYVKALMEHGIALNEKWVIADRDLNTNEQFVPELPDELPEIFVCNSDQVAVKIAELAESRGLTIGVDLDIGGFDNYQLSPDERHEFTTYDVQMEKMVRLAVQTLLHKIQGDDYLKGLQTVTGKLVHKE